MSASRHTDYYQFSWKVVVPQERLSLQNLGRYLILGMIVVLLLGLFWLLNQSLQFSSYEFFWLMFTFVLAFVGVIGFFMQQIARLYHDYQVHFYHLDSLGFQDGNMVIPIDTIIADKTLASLARQPHGQLTRSNFIYFDLPHLKGRLRVYFNNSTEWTRFKKAIEKYLST